VDVPTFTTALTAAEKAGVGWLLYVSITVANGFENQGLAMVGSWYTKT